MTSSSFPAHSSVRVAVSAQAIAKTFWSRGRPPTVALTDVNVEVLEGAFVVLLGASGCGKTTLLRIMAGLERPTDGRIEVFGQEVTKPSGTTAVVFQTPVLLPWRTILENVLLPVEIQRRKGKKEWRDRALELLARTGLEAFANHYPRELSGGMRQRAAICRGLILDPAVLLMDEPFGALDAITRAGMNEELYEIWQRTGKTVVFVTHDIQEAVRLGTHVVVMTPRPGRVAQISRLEIAGESYEERTRSSEFFEYVRKLEVQIEATISGPPAN